LGKRKAPSLKGGCTSGKKKKKEKGVGHVYLNRGTAKRGTDSEGDLRKESPHTGIGRKQQKGEQPFSHEKPKVGGGGI